MWPCEFRQILLPLSVALLRLHPSCLKARVIVGPQDCINLSKVLKPSFADIPLLGSGWYEFPKSIKGTINILSNFNSAGRELHALTRVFNVLKLKGPLQYPLYRFMLYGNRLFFYPLSFWIAVIWAEVVH